MIRNFFCKWDQIHRKLRIWSDLLKKSLTKKFTFLCSVNNFNIGSEIWRQYHSSDNYSSINKLLLMFNYSYFPVPLFIIFILFTYQILKNAKRMTAKHIFNKRWQQSSAKFKKCFCLPILMSDNKKLRDSIKYTFIQIC